MCQAAERQKAFALQVSPGTALLVMKDSAEPETLSMSLTILWDGVHGAMEDAAVDQENASCFRFLSSISHVHPNQIPTHKAFGRMTNAFDYQAQIPVAAHCIS